MDNYVNALKYYDLILERPLEALPEYPLPEGYAFRFYQPGDRDRWIELEISAQEFICYEEGLAAWNRYYGGYEALLPQRMVFVVNPSGQLAATATAFFERGDSAGWLHWVAVHRDFQGRGLSKPVIAKALAALRELGYQKAKIPTQTSTWVAVKVYLDFGFLPEPMNAGKNEMGWRIIRTLTNHPALKGFAPLPEDALWDPSVLSVEKQLRGLYPDIGRIKVWQGGEENQALFILDGKIRKALYRAAPQGEVTVCL